MCPLRLGRSQIHPFREEVSVAKHVIVSETHTHTERERSIFHNCCTFERLPACETE